MDMREYVFLLEYDYGVHPVRDVFIDHPDVVASTLDTSISHDTGWRVESLIEDVQHGAFARELA